MAVNTNIKNFFTYREFRPYTTILLIRRSSKYVSPRNFKELLTSNYYKIFFFYNNILTFQKYLWPENNIFVTK